MKFELHEGCVTGGLYINGKLEYDLTDSEMELTLNVILNEIRKGIKEDTISLRNVLYCIQSDDEIDHGHCDQCGDHSYTTIWEFEEGKN